MAAEFEIEGRRFEISHLSLDESFAGLEKAQAVFGASGQIPFAKVPELLRMFAKVCKVARAPDGSFVSGGAMVALDPFLKDVFVGNVGLSIKFLTKAIEHEYGAFLDEMRVAALVSPSTPPTP
jgi:hypothetical protein